MNGPTWTDPICCHRRDKTEIRPDIDEYSLLGKKFSNRLLNL